MCPVVGINGNGHTTLRLVPGSSSSQILALSVTNSSGNGITLGSSNNVLNYNHVLHHLGRHPATGATASTLPRTAKKNRIGTNPTNTPQYAANIISGNRARGIRPSVRRRTRSRPTGSVQTLRDRRLWQTNTVAVEFFGARTKSVAT